MAIVASGCQPDHDKSSLIERVSDALAEVGASRPMTACLTRGLAHHLAEADAEVAYEDLASEPDVSEVSLNRVSLLEKSVKERLLSRAERCRALLVSRGLYSRRQVDHMLHQVGARGYRKPGLFLRR